MKETNFTNTLATKREDYLRENISETTKIENYVFTIVLLLGASGFLITGISSYIKFNIIPFLNAEGIIFFPQGITMCFYGTLGILLATYQLYIINSKVGEGYNEFDKTKGILKIFRKGFPGKNSDVNLTYPLKDIEAIKIEVKTEIFNSKQNIYICIKGKPDLPILQIKTPLKINELEEKAIKLASFLNVPIKGL